LYESGYAKWKKVKEQEERIKKLPKLTIFFSKTTTDTTSTYTSTSRLVSTIAEENKSSLFKQKHVVRLRVRILLQTLQ
jgi:hypothetical protein